MSPDAQRISIAEACGWTGCHSVANLPCGIAPGEREHRQVPDYLNDLNAMHEAEKVLKDWNKYVCMVAKVIVGDTRPRAAGNLYHVASSVLIHATASHRAEAFLRTIGKWTSAK